MVVGIVGSGFIVEDFLQAANKNEGIELSGIYSRDPQSERIKSLCERYGIRKAYGNYEDMLSDKNINFVYVASPNSLHFSYSLKALNAGKNVICEKPFTSTFKEAEELYRTAVSKGLMIFEAIVTLYLPNFKIVEENIDSIGPVRSVQLNYSQYSSRYDKFLAGANPNVFNPEFSGGSLMDINIYNVHFMVRLFGKPLSAVYYPRKAENGIDTSGTAIFNYPGFVASLTGAKDADSDNFVIIQGEKGTIYVADGANYCEDITVKKRGSESALVLNEQREKNHLFYELKTFKKIFEEKDYSLCYKTCEYSLDVISLVEEIRTAAGISFPADENKI